MDHIMDQHYSPLIILNWGISRITLQRWNDDLVSRLRNRKGEAIAGNKMTLLLGSLASPSHCSSESSKLTSESRSRLRCRLRWRRCIFDWHRRTSGRHLLAVLRLCGAITYPQVAQPQGVVDLAPYSVKSPCSFLHHPKLFEELVPPDDSIVASLQPVGSVKGRSTRCGSIAAVWLVSLCSVLSRGR